jgi:hypothetical protein
MGFMDLLEYNRSPTATILVSIWNLGNGFGTTPGSEEECIETSVCDVGVFHG